MKKGDGTHGSTAHRALTLTELVRIYPHLPDAERYPHDRFAVDLTHEDESGATHHERVVFERSRFGGTSFTGDRTEAVWLYDEGPVIMNPLMTEPPYTIVPPNPQRIIAPLRTDTINLFVPLPPDELQVNRRLRMHGAKANTFAARAWKEAQAALRAQVTPSPAEMGWEGCDAMATFFLHATRRTQDDDNLEGWLKTTRDALAAALGFDDKHWHWVEQPERITVKHTEKVFLMLTRRGEP